MMTSLHHAKYSKRRILTIIGHCSHWMKERARERMNPSIQYENRGFGPQCRRRRPDPDTAINSGAAEEDAIEAAAPQH